MTDNGLGYIRDAYKKYRDGQQLTSIINIRQKQVYQDEILMSSSGHHSIRDLYIGDVGVRSGGKWYWELELKSEPRYLAIGWVNRKYRLSSRSIHLGNDVGGNSWALAGPRNQYLHRG